MSRKLKQIIALLLTAALFSPAGWIAPIAKAAAPEIPVMLFHRIVVNATDDWTHTSVENFTKQMKYLSDNGYNSLSAEQYVDILDGTESAPDKPILLTFDDATPDFITHALPILKQYQMKSVQFVVSDWINGGYSMTTSQLQALAEEPSVSLQNHSQTHSQSSDTAGGEIWTSSITKEQAASEIAAANDYLKNHTGKDPILFAYPYGTFNENAEAAAAESNIKYAFKVGYPNQGSYAMGRHYMQRTTTLSQFATLVGGPAPTEQTQINTVYHESFAGGKGAATQSGNASLTLSTDKTFDGNADGAALSVSNRQNDYDAVDFKFATIGLTNGKTYSVTVSGYVDADVIVPAGAQAALQTVDSYGWLAGAEFVAGKAFTLTKEFTVDTSKDVSLRVQSNSTGATVPFYIGDVLITEKVASGGGEEEETRPPALDFTAITFENQTTNGFVGRAGTETLTVTNEANHTENGSYALKVENRSDSWHAPSLRVEKYVDKGSEYKISLWAKLISPASSQLQLSTQVGNSSPSYITLSAKTINASDGWVQFEGTYRYTNIGDEYLTIYLESSNQKTASFYIDDVRFEKVGTGPIVVEKDLTPLKDAYQNDFLIGNAVSSNDLAGVRLELLKMHHNVITAENAMKPDQMQPTKGNFTFAGADSLVDKALAEGLKVHGHVLVWHQQTPAWMSSSDDAPLGREEALANMKNHIKTVMEHYGNKVISWDVVNEAMNDNPSNPSDWKAALRQAPWKSAIGTDYVEQAFLLAREVLDENPEWDIKLYYNDYNDDNQNKAHAIYSMVKEINDKYALTHPGKLLIDGVGMQAHYNVNTNPANVKLSLEKFISLGVEVSITELDVQAGSNYQLPEQLANAQGYLYAQLFELYKANAEHIKRVTFWGLNDSSSWRAENNPLLFNKDLLAKPAYHAVINPDKYLKEHAPVTVDAKQSSAQFGTPTIDGTVDSVWSSAPEIPINRYQMAWQGATGVAKTLWDNENLYVLVQVRDAQLDKSSAAEHEQDSVEIFVDENNGKSSFYQDDDGQYRVNFDNQTSFNPTSFAEGFVSATKISGTNYTVEVKIPFKKVTPGADKKIGFDVQINDAKDGARQSVATWNDTTGNNYMDTSGYGILTLSKNNTVPPGDPVSSGPAPSTGVIEMKDGFVTIHPLVKSDGSRTTGTVSDETLKKALAQAAPAANGKKQVVIEVPKQSNANAYEVQLPTQSLKGTENFVLSMKSEQATIDIPSNMLSDVTVNAEQVSVRVSKSTTDHMDASTRQLVGNRPVLDLSLVVDGKAIAWNNAKAPVTISIPYTPTAEELSNPDSIVVWYIADNGEVTAIPNGRYVAATGRVVFQTTHFSTYAVASVLKTFGDLNHVPWAKQAIDAMAARDVIKGSSENSFSPAASIKRADFIALLVRALELQGTGKNEETFSDVEKSAYYYNELVIAKELGIVTGFADHTLKPNSPISRQDMMVLTTRALAATTKPLEKSGTLDTYPDAASISDYAKDSVESLVNSGIVNGKNGTIAPNDLLTRAEAAVILYRIWNL
ncbi:endo-1,4-beta-xylanase [Paenibacillus luteus]|uniref:endo-1,4-beta-xylanase n=1 Tax=Paenibacillus luteus TaxID=2545753 RepID=UPI001143DB78|nr:endo-1,4-beta-xylanase [Paenibacillus luteus]